MTSTACTSVLALVLSLPLLVACDPPPFETQFRDDLHSMTYTVDIRDGVAEEVLIDVPEGTGSMLIEVRGGRSKYGIFEFIEPPLGGSRNGVRVNETSVFTVRDSGKAGLANWIYPSDERHRVVAGTYRLRVKATDFRNNKPSNEEAEITVYFVKEKPQETCEVFVDFLIDEEALIEEKTEQAMNDVFQDLKKNFAPAGINIRPGEAYRIDMGSPDIQPGGKSVPAIVDNVLSKARTRGLISEHAIHAFVVRKIGAEDAPAGQKVFDPNGYSMGLPGPFEDRSTSAVMVSTEKYAPGYILDTEAFASSLTHEIGHFLGLHHTSEEGGQRHDPIGDTPQSNDSARSAEFQRNFMTSALWGINIKERDTFTPAQAKIMRGHPLCIPASFQVPTPAPDLESCDLACGDGLFCSNFSGQQVCTTRCFDGLDCTSGQCVPDHNLKLSCMP